MYYDSTTTNLIVLAGPWIALLVVFTVALTWACRDLVRCIKELCLPAKVACP